MAVFNYPSASFVDNWPLNLDALATLDVKTWGDTVFGLGNNPLFEDDRQTATFTGIGLQFALIDSIPGMLGGTLTGFTTTRGGFVYTEISGWDISAVTFFELVAAQDYVGVARLAMSGNDTVNGSDGDDRIAGGAKLDKLYGYAGDDRLDGGTSNDFLAGGAGEDKLSGGTGRDTLAGGTGHDRLFGDEGADRFLFETAVLAANSDVVSGFVSGVDRVLLDQDVFDELALGPLAEANFVLGPKAVDGKDFVIYDRATGNLFYDQDAAGGANGKLIANFGAGTQLTFADIEIIA